MRRRRREEEEEEEEDCRSDRRTDARNFYLRARRATNLPPLALSLAGKEGRKGRFSFSGFLGVEDTHDLMMGEIRVTYERST